MPFPSIDDPDPQLGPRARVKRRAPACYRLAVVARVSLGVGTRILKPGDVMAEAPNAFCGQHVAGPEGSTSFKVFSSLTASYGPNYEAPHGPVQVNAPEPGAVDKLTGIMIAQIAAE